MGYTRKCAKFEVPSALWSSLGLHRMITKPTARPWVYKYTPPPHLGYLSVSHHVDYSLFQKFGLLIHNIYRFPQSFQGSMGESDPEARSAEGSDDAQTLRKWLGERASRMHLRYESRDLQKKRGRIRCLPRPVSLIFMNIKETEPEAWIRTTLF